MKKFFLILLTASVCRMSSAVSQTLTVTAETLDTCKVPALSIDISVENFTDMFSAQFTVAWDPAVLSYSHVGHSMAPPQAPLFVPNAGAGTLQFSWFDLGMPPGYDHPDGVLFTIHFNVVGNYGDMSPINFISTGPFPIEFFNTSGQVNNFIMTPGAVYFDNTDPVISGCPANPIVVSAPFGSVTYPVSWTAPVATDECGLVSFTSNYSPGNSFVVADPPVTVTYTAVDSAGNTAVCNFTVDVIEGPNPNALTFTAVGDSLFCGDTVVAIPITVKNFIDMRTAQFGIQWNPAVLRYDTVMDMMNFPFLYPMALYNDKDSLNGRLRFGWNDADFLSDPGEDIPDGDTIFILKLCLIDPAATSTTVSFAAFPFQAGPPMFAPYPIEFTNTSGTIPNNQVVLNNATIVNVPDVTNPAIACPAPIVVSTDANLCTKVVNYTAPVGTDNCPNPVTTQTAGLASGVAYPKGVTTNTFKVTDGAGNMATCSFTVTVNDTQAPAITCPSAIGAVTDPNACTTVVNYTAPVGTDNCPMASTAQTAGLTSGATYPKGVTTNTFTVTDMAGNTKSCSFTVTVTDAQSPAITCPANISANTAPGVCTAVVNYTAPVGTDNCPMASTAQTAGLASGASFPKGVTTNTFTVTDMAGNTESCSFTVTVTDNQAPGITCPADSLYADTDCTVSLPNYTGLALVSDNCSALANITVTQTPAPGTAVSDDVSVKLVAQDESGNKDSCTFTVLFFDTIAPNITCPANVAPLNANASCQATLPNYAGQATKTDNCSAAANITVTQSPTAGTVISDTTTVKLVAEDEAGNLDSCTFVVTIKDITSPSISCPGGNQTLFADADCEASLPDYTGMATASDNCTPTDSIKVTQAAPAGTVITGNVTVTIMAMDMAGNAASCQFQVMLADTLPPSIACPANQTLSANADCEASLPDYAGMATLSDNCSALADIGLTQSPAAGTLISSTTTITLYAEDEEGNVDSCTFQVSIVDDSAPVLSACNSQTLSANADCEATLPDYRDSINVSDNCSATANIDLIQFPPAGSVIDDDTTVKIYAEDEAGNLDSCSFVVFFEDNASPTITCPSDIAKTTDPGSCSAVVTWPAPTVVDNCDDTPDFICMPPSGTTFPVGDSMVMCMAEDIAGNRDTCFFMVSVSDGENPFLECPPNDTIKVPAGVTSVVLTGISLFSIFDNCGVDTSYYHLTGDTNGGGNGIDASGETFNVGVTTIAYFATDAAGNTGTCSFTITIEAGQLVNLTCPANASAGTDTDLCTAVVNNLTPSATPAANLDTLFFQLSGAMLGSGANDASGTAFPVGTTTVAYIALSVTGDTSTCTVTVEVEDTQSPAFTNCPTAPIILSNTPDLCGLKYAGNILPVATDNCPGLVIDYLPSSGVLLPLGWSAVSAQATDAAGNTDICTFSIRVDDSQPPTISGCQNLAPGITMDTEPGKCGAVVNWTPPTATDNCQLIAFTVSQDSGTFFQAGLTPVEYVAVDSSGNVSKCVFNVTVNDTEKPTISPCPIDIGKSTDPGECFATVNWQTPVASDNCGVVSFNQTHQPGTTFDVGFHTVEYVATDAKGNMTKCTFNVQVADLEPPAINNLINSVVLYSVPDLCGNFVNWQLPTASDNCGLQSFMGTITPGSFFPVTPANNPHIVEYTALDIHGNANVKVFTVTMLDTIKPKLICPQNVTVSVDGGVISDPSGVITALQSVDCQKMKLEFSHPTATDACGISALTQSGGPIPGSTFTAGNNIITYLATDNNGNQRTCSYIIKVEGVAPLQASSSPASPCAGEPVILSVNQYPGATYTWKNPQGQVVSMASSFTLPGVTAAQAGSYTVEVKLPTCNLQGSVNLTVSPKPDVVATANSPLCSNGDATLNLTATDQAGVGVVQWIWNYPNNSIVNGQNQTIFNATSSNAGTYSVTAVTANGCSATATVQVEVSQHPVPAISGTSAAVCTGSQVVLNGQLFPGNSVTYHWSAEPMQGSGLTPIDNAIVNVTPSQPGDYTYSFYVVVDGCISDTAEWVINVQAPPSLVLAVDGDTKCVDGSTSVSLTETGGVATNWQWTGPNGFTSNEQNPTLQNIGIGTSGTYSVTSTTSNGCVSTASIPVAVTEQPAEAELFASSTAICDGASVTLTGTPYPAGAVYLWTGQNLPPFSQTKSTITVTPGQMGSFDYTFAAVVDGCTTNVVSVSILVENTPPVNITLDGSTECVNGTTSVTLKPNAPGANTYVWKGPNGTVISDQENLVLNNVTAANSGTYTLTASSFIGCQMSGSFSLTITDALPAVTALLVETPCEDGTLRLSTEPNIPGAVYEWKNSSGKIIANIQSPTLTGIIPALSGKYTVTVSKNGCTSTSEPLEVTILAYPVAQDETVLGLVNTPQSFNVVVNDDLQGEYSIKVMQNPMHGTVTYDGNGVFTYTPEKDFRENDQMIYQVCYEDCPGLCDVALVTILVRYPGDQCVITSVISPNNDGINDELIVSCLEVADHPLNKLIIFNQWGDKVYEAAPYKNDWQGTYNGKDLPDGTYFYIFQRDPDLPAAKGFVMIYR